MDSSDYEIRSRKFEVALGLPTFLKYIFINCLKGTNAKHPDLAAIIDFKDKEYSSKRKVIQFIGHQAANHHA
jgi:hypothetical protein